MRDSVGGDCCVVVARTDLLSTKVFLLVLVLVQGMPAMIPGLISDYRPCSDASVQITIWKNAVIVSLILLITIRVWVSFQATEIEQQLQLLSNSNNNYNNNNNTKLITCEKYWKFVEKQKLSIIYSTSNSIFIFSLIRVIIGRSKSQLSQYPI